MSTLSNSAQPSTVLIEAPVRYTRPVARSVPGPKNVPVPSRPFLSRPVDGAGPTQFVPQTLQSAHVAFARRGRSEAQRPSGLLIAQLPVVPQREDLPVCGLHASDDRLQPVFRLRMDRGGARRSRAAGEAMGEVPRSIITRTPAAQRDLPPRVPFARPEMPAVNGHQPLAQGTGARRMETLAGAQDTRPTAVPRQERSLGVHPRDRYGRPLGDPVGSGSCGASDPRAS